MPGPGVRGSGNTGNMKTPEQLAYEKAIKDAMIKKAMQEKETATPLTNQNNNPANNGMMQTPAPNQPSTKSNVSTVTGKTWEDMSNLERDAHRLGMNVDIDKINPNQMGAAQEWLNNYQNQPTTQAPEQALTLGGPPALTQAEDLWNLQGTREGTGNGGGLFSGLSDWETATLLDSQGLLGDTSFNPNEVEGSGGPRGGGANRTDRYNSWRLNNYSGPAFETTDDIYTYVDGLNLNTDRRTFKGGRGGIMETADTSGQNQLKADANTFINQQNFNLTGQQPVYEKDGKVYVLNTGYAGNLPKLDGPIPFSGRGGMYHEAAGSPQGIGEYRIYEPQNKAGPDTDMLSDQIMPAVQQIAISAMINAAMPGAAAFGGGLSGSVLSGAASGAAGSLGNQVLSGDIDLGQVARGALVGGAGGALTYTPVGPDIMGPPSPDTYGMLGTGIQNPVKFDNFVGDFSRGAIGDAAGQFIADGSVDVSQALTSGAIGLGTGAVKDMFGDSYQTNEDELLGKGEGAQTVNSRDAVSSDGRGGAYITSAGEEVLNSTDFRGFLGPNGALAQATGLDIPYMPTDYLGNAYDFLEDIGLGDLTTFALDFAGIEHGSTTSKETQLWDFDENGEPIYKDVNVETPNRYDERFFDIFSERGDTGEMTGIWTRNPNDWHGKGGFGGFNILGNMGNPYGQTAATPNFGDADYYSNPESPGFLTNDYSGNPTASIDEDIYNNLNSVFDGDSPEDLNSAELDDIINQLSEEETAAAEGPDVIT